MALGEFGRIDKYFKPLAAATPGALGLTDDAAVLPIDGLSGLVVSADAVVEGVHFLSTDDPALIARKALRTNLSDLAAMGAEPWVYTLTLALGPSAGPDPDAWVAGLADGLALDQGEFGIRLVGGDSVSTPGPVMLSITIFGKPSSEGSLLRSTARAGDDVYVSGTIGDAVVGLKLLQDAALDVLCQEREELISRYHLPRPRINLGTALRGVASAALDVSDGVVQDLGHLCRESGFSARVDLPKVPFSAPVARLLESGAIEPEEILGGGDDYELLFTAPPDSADRVIAASRSSGVPVARIGVVGAGEGVSVFDHGERLVPLRRLGYRHG